MTEPEPPDPDDDGCDYWELIADLDETEEEADYRNGYPPKA
jgi:hypothetical protein